MLQYSPLYIDRSGTSTFFVWSLVGEVKGRKANESLTAEDCYQIGRTAYLNEDYYHCKLWMKEVLLRNKKTYISFDEFDVLDHLAFCTARLGDILGASDLTLNILQIEPDNERIQGNYRYYFFIIEFIRS